MQLFRGILGLARLLVSDPRRFMERLSAQADAEKPLHSYLQYRDGLPGVAPLNFAIDPQLDSRPTLNVLLPGMAMRAMSGGPNTAINLAYRLAAHGVALRFISTDIPMDENHEPIRAHFASLTGLPADLPNVEIVCAFDRSKPLLIGRNDVFFASAWWNVQMIKRGLALTGPKRFLYIVQDFEPGLYAWSTRHALALETYNLDFHGIICGNFLADYLFESRVGRFGEPDFRAACTVFEPAVDRNKFYPDPVKSRFAVRRLLFYARPTSAERNLFELGLYALRCAVMTGVFAQGQWEFLFIGEALPDVDLGAGITIRSAPWLNYEGYAGLMRSSDVVLSLMLSPHTSYPPLEAAAAGAVAVTNSYANKTADALTAVSPNIVSVPPTLEGVVEGLTEAVRRLGGERPGRGLLNVPADWDESFAETVPRVLAMLELCRASGEGQL
ncbi:hypothetical protein [Bosea sp. (in: a-proteobacteria)]|uniref:rhamnosyltransferase WsaF family glycosyltransferase n=1 Tax=Bosea sp. (in: a-proteobacteria) TaxID=1871050 RepID=UPI003B3A6C77